MYRPIVVLSSLVFALSAVAAEAADPTDKCHSSKLKESAKYASCRIKAESKAVLVGGAPDFSKCTAKFPSKFNDAETKAGMGVCPTEGDGTITDTTTGLMWEKKIALDNYSVTCTTETGSCANPHDADNRYDLDGG